MTNGQFSIRMCSVMVTVAAAMTVQGGCASKQVASTSGDQSTTITRKAEPLERIKQEPMASMEGGSSLEGAPIRGAGKDSRVQAPSSGSLQGSSLAPGSSPESAASTASLSDIYFDFDQYTVRRDAEGMMEANANLLRAGSGSVVIEGHCDERGTLAYNLVLGEKRAKSVKRYLEELGIPGSRIQTTSYGEVRPFCRDHNEACWGKNRRAHFVVQ
jgi:peptidoglycan-associated lipoprotein